MRTLLASLRCRRGTASLELAIVAPMLIAMVLSISDVAMLSMAKFKSMNATATASDLATQSSNLQATDMADVFAGTMNVMAPLGTTGLSLRISAIASSGKGNAFVFWSCGIGTLPPLSAGLAVSSIANGDTVSNVLNLSNFTSGGFIYNGTDTTFVQAETSYAYTTPTQFLIKGPQVLTATYVNYPRQAAYVGFPWDGTSINLPASPTAALRGSSVTLSNGATCNYMM